jgi:hypothetical protein
MRRTLKPIRQRAGCSGDRGPADDNSDTQSGGRCPGADPPTHPRPLGGGRIKLAGCTEVRERLRAAADLGLRRRPARHFQQRGGRGVRL